MLSFVYSLPRYNSFIGGFKLWTHLASRKLPVTMHIYCQISILRSSCYSFMPLFMPSYNIFKFLKLFNIETVCLEIFVSFAACFHDCLSCIQTADDPSIWESLKSLLRIIQIHPDPSQIRPESYAILRRRNELFSALVTW